MVIDGRLRVAVCWVTNRSSGGVLNPEDLDTKTGLPVIDVLKDKHPEYMTPDIGQDGWASFGSYDDHLYSVLLDCNQETVIEVVSKMSGGTYPSSVGAVEMNKWLLR